MILKLIFFHLNRYWKKIFSFELKMIEATSFQYLTPIFLFDFCRRFWQHTISDRWPPGQNLLAPLTGQHRCQANIPPDPSHPDSLADHTRESKYTDLRMLVLVDSLPTSLCWICYWRNIIAIFALFVCIY